MTPRYTPGIDLRALLCLFDLSSGDEGAQARVVRQLTHTGGPPFATAFESMRKGLFVYFSTLRRRIGSGDVLMSAQICPIVPKVIQMAGFEVAFVDIAASSPTPSAEQFARAIGSRTVAVLVAPFYGHLQTSWKMLTDGLEGRHLVLDLAQGLGLAENVGALASRADAVAYSFGPGKGLDSGGGLLLTRTPLDMSNLVRSSALALARPIMQCIGLRCVISLGLYSSMIGNIDNANYDQDISWGQETGFLAPNCIFAAWESRLKIFSVEVARGRERAAHLQKIMAKSELLRDVDALCNGEATHLRQLIRARSSESREKLINRLRRGGIDCAPAGEPLPGEYINALSGTEFPNAAGFHSEAIRLPFLGRLSDHQFSRFTTALESALDERLS